MGERMSSGNPIDNTSNIIDTLRKRNDEPKGEGSQENVSTSSNIKQTSFIQDDMQNEVKCEKTKTGQDILQSTSLQLEKQPSLQECIDNHSGNFKAGRESTKVNAKNDLRYHNLDQRIPLQTLALSDSTSDELVSQSSRDVINRSSPTSDTGFEEKSSISEDERVESSTSEIKCIIEQFGEKFNGIDDESVMLSRPKAKSSLLGDSIQHPPRKSSLEPITPTKNFPDLEDSNTQPDQLKSKLLEVRPGIESSSITSVVQTHFSDESYKSLEAAISPSLQRPPPPEPESEPVIPFDFHHFLEQLRNKSADPVAKYLRSFLQEFGKKQWMVHEQVKIIRDFLIFISNKMEQCEVWAELSDSEFDNAREGMEKLVMNRLYSQTFSPAIQPPQPISGSKSKRKGDERPMGPGRRGQHQEDVERDEILAQKVSIYGWIKEEHLDFPPVLDSGRNFLVIAKRELLKIKTYRAPRDKIICVLNCCKLGLLKHLKSDSSADSFMPLLIYVILQANPEHLVSNVQYILRFRNQEKLVGEVGYYLSSLLGAVHFIENLDRTTLTISDDDFEKNVEAAVSAIAEKHQAQANESIQLSPEANHRKNEKNPRSLTEVEGSNIKKHNSSDEYESSDGPSEKAPIGSLLRTIQRPLSSIGWIFSEDSSASQNWSTQVPQSDSTLIPISTSQLVEENCEDVSCHKDVQTSYIKRDGKTDNIFEKQTNSFTTSKSQPQRNEYSSIAETLASMFPDLDKEIIRDVVVQKEGMVGLAVDVCLALSSE
ncbi:Vacuolar protein sorting-associated protein 9a [Erysiphe neolycopersici]|uniref:Vacuolar protein sorting-associated protein 9a n=1 Tax=Erysiphe neolycopersici TaxID=212602 RepID=A0A420HFN6_9PEZI|nr:Vacuolar protein sorting-associated protein 9a [Erysiphe neolycopersici]